MGTGVIDAFYDYQWHLVHNPLYEQFQRWKAGEVSHLEIDEAIHKMHKACQKVYGLFTSKRDFLVSVIQFNEEWFPEWVKDHPRPKISLHDLAELLGLRNQFA